VKKDHGSFFLEMAWSSGLSRYVIRGITIFGRCSTIYGLDILHNVTALRCYEMLHFETHT